MDQYYGGQSHPSDDDDSYGQEEYAMEEDTLGKWSCRVDTGMKNIDLVRMKEATQVATTTNSRILDLGRQGLRGYD